ncbi:MAG: hypothetical protein ACPGJV_16110 [Bacteriovoracaceae bacterium]
MKVNSKSIKIIYIDQCRVMTKFWERSLKDKLELISLNDLSMLEHNFKEFAPDLIVIDAITLKALNSEWQELKPELKKASGAKLVVSGTKDELDKLAIIDESVLLKPLDPLSMFDLISNLLSNDRCSESLKGSH